MPIPKPISILQSYTGMKYGWYSEYEGRGHEGDACVSECLPDTEEARDFRVTLDA